MALRNGGTVPVHVSRRAAIAVVAALAVIGAVSCSSKADDGDSGASDTTDTTSVPAEEVLGTPNEATGSPITVGFVSDGPDASFGSDENEVATFDATVEYVNAYLGGVNGHPLEVQHCSTDNTPAGATQCAADLIDADVATVLVPVSAQDGKLFGGLAESGIPYFTYESADQDVLLQPGAFLMTNPISQIATPGLVAQEQGIDKVGFILIDVPAATGPITSIAEPIYNNLGVDLKISPVSPSVADMTPQLQEAISGGAGMFTVVGTDDFNINGVNGLRQLGFTGPIMLGNPVQGVLDQLTTFDNLLGNGTQTNHPSDPDVQLMNAVVETYTDLDTADAFPKAFATVLGFVRALDGSADAVDAATISTALSSMPETDLPLGGGITFQCGTDPVSFAPSICSTDVLQWSYDADGNRQDFGLVNVPADALTLG